MLSGGAVSPVMAAQLAAHQSDTGAARGQVTRTWVRVADNLDTGTCVLQDQGDGCTAKRH